MLEVKFSMIDNYLKVVWFFLSQQKCLKPLIILVKVMKHKCFRKTSCLKVWTQSWTFTSCELSSHHSDSTAWSIVAFPACSSRRDPYRPFHMVTKSPYSGQTYLYWKPWDKYISITLMLHLQKQVEIAKKISELR